MASVSMAALGAKRLTGVPLRSTRNFSERSKEKGRLVKSSQPVLFNLQIPFSRTEIPSDFDRTAFVRECMFQETKHLTCFGAIDIGFLEECEFFCHFRIKASNKLNDFLVCSRLLGSELITRKR